MKNPISAKNIVKSAMIAGLMLGTAMSLPAVAQAQATGPVVPGLAVADLEGAVANSNAFKTAASQRPVTYKAQIDQATARRNAISAQLQPLYDKLKRDSEAATPNQAALQTQYQQIQQIENAGQQELQRIVAPAAASEAYVQEQIEDKLDQAVKNAMNAKKISLLLNPQAILAVNNQAYNLTTDITAQLNTMIPAAQLVPPQGWEPRRVREQRAAQAAQQGAAAAPAQPASPQPQGR
jgi:Skp family chaperone for outer membrane proteins